MSHSQFLTVHTPLMTVDYRGSHFCAQMSENVLALSNYLCKQDPDKIWKIFLPDSAITHSPLKLRPNQSDLII